MGHSGGGTGDEKVAWLGKELSIKTKQLREVLERLEKAETDLRGYFAGPEYAWGGKVLKIQAQRWREVADEIATEARLDMRAFSEKLTAARAECMEKDNQIYDLKRRLSRKKPR